MGMLLRCLCLSAAVIGAAVAQNQDFQVLENSIVVDQDFNVVGELHNGETLFEFSRRYRQQNPGSAEGSGGFPGATVPRVPAAASSPEPLGLPAGATKMFGTISQDFSCEGLPYGYYADKSNNCQIYHICNPIGGQRSETLQYSFFCNAGLEFDQYLLTCVRGPSRTGCGNADRFYASSNRQFGADVDFNAGGEVADETGPSGLSGPTVLIGVDGGVPVSQVEGVDVSELRVPPVPLDQVFGPADGAGSLDLRFSLPQ